MCVVYSRGENEEGNEGGGQQAYGERGAAERERQRVTVRGGAPPFLSPPHPPHAGERGEVKGGGVPH